MDKQPLYIAFVWHMHQPYYKNDLTGKYSLPWVRLHCTKDYYDMVAILDDFPNIHQTFNLVPSLLIQIEDYVKNGATDEFLEKTLIPAHELSEADKDFILANFFMANWNTMVYAYPRYAELLDKRGRYTMPAELARIKRYFRPQDYLDLQVLFNLVWIDPYWKERDTTLQTLSEKGRGFTEEDKHYIIQKHKQIMSEVIDKYRQVQDRGQIEITTTPFYHPILPLVCNTDAAKVATPQIVLPRTAFRHPEDARLQVQRAVDYYVHHFGKKPKGMWPSEGSVSEDIIPLLADAGIKWIATDEDILANTLKMVIRKDLSPDSCSDVLYTPYELKIKDKQLNIIFRDRTLSDLVGFTYSHMSVHDAVNNFMGILRVIHEQTRKQSSPHLVSIILDGENAWEFYQNDGNHFLKQLYTELSNSQHFQAVTVSEFLEKFPPERVLHNLFAGSWINHNFGVWIGHQEDNTAWEYLFKTREALIHFTQVHPEDEHKATINQAWEEIYIAEGSDWCWWYGDDHSSANDEEFDSLFRQHLMNVYKLIGEKIPDWLFVAIKGIAKSKPAQYPLGLIHPVLDGKLTDYYEWQNAGIYEVSKTGGTMYRANTVINTIFYGFDLNNLYLRLDFNTAFDTSEMEDLALMFTISEPKQFDLTFPLENKVAAVLSVFDTSEPSSPKKVGELTSFSINKFLEICIPFSILGFSPDQNVTMNIIVKRKDFEIERWPKNGLISFKVPGEDYILDYWEV